MNRTYVAESLPRSLRVASVLIAIHAPLTISTGGRWLGPAVLLFGTILKVQSLCGEKVDTPLIISCNNSKNSGGARSRRGAPANRRSGRADVGSDRRGWPSCCCGVRPRGLDPQGRRARPWRRPDRVAALSRPPDRAVARAAGAGRAPADAHTGRSRGRDGSDRGAGCGGPFPTHEYLDDEIR